MSRAQHRLFRMHTASRIQYMYIDIFATKPSLAGGFRCSPRRAATQSAQRLHILSGPPGYNIYLLMDDCATSEACFRSRRRRLCRKPTIECHTGPTKKKHGSWRQIVCHRMAATVACINNCNPPRRRIMKNCATRNRHDTRNQFLNCAIMRK